MATRTSNRPYQIVIFGASGFTGQFVVEEVSRAADGEDYRGQELRWAVAGRSKKKLEEVLNWAAERLGECAVMEGSGRPCLSTVIPLS